LGVERRRRKERGKRKHVTTVGGLEAYGIKLKEAASALGKRFGAGASVGKSATGGAEIDVQGDVAADLPELLVKLYPDIKPESIRVKEL
jgi:density-regulated protein DRP1